MGEKMGTHPKKKVFGGGGGGFNCYLGGTNEK